MKSLKLSFCLEYREEIKDYVIKCQIHHPMFVDQWWVIQSFDRKPNKETVNNVIYIARRSMDIMLNTFRLSKPYMENEHDFTDYC